MLNEFYSLYYISIYGLLQGFVKYPNSNPEAPFWYHIELTHLTSYEYAKRKGNHLL
jgi:hypothetical protein